MLILHYDSLNHFIFLFHNKIDALQRFSFQLVDKIVQCWEASDINNTVIIWWVWNLNPNTKHAHKYWSQLRALDEMIICSTKHTSWSSFFKHSEDHADETSHNIYFWHNALHQRIISCQLELILFQWVVES